MAKKGLITLEDLDTYALAEGTASVDSAWASSSILSVIRVNEQINKVRKFAALVGHFSSPDAEVLGEFLEEGTQWFGNDTTVIIRGGAVLVRDSDPKQVKGIFTKMQKEERARFLKTLKAHGYEKDRLDIAWAEANHGTKIIYDARSGIAEVLTQVIDMDDANDLPDVF
jgi:hypothetical protein